MESLKRHHMRFCKIADMNEVADTGTVRSIIISPMDCYVFASSGGCLEGKRDQMGFRIMVLSYLSFGISARRVEIAQRNGIQAVRGDAIAQDAFDHQFRGAIGINRTLRMIL